jgi:hypothetical protein
MTRRLLVLKTQQSLTTEEAERCKNALRFAIAHDSALVLGYGLDLSIVEIDDDTCRCEYCHNQIDKCGCGAARLKVGIDSSGRI